MRRYTLSWRKTSCVLYLTLSKFYYQQRSSVSLEIHVKDENDNAPQFSKDAYKVAISENATIGSSVIRVLASDPDHGSNADLAFTVQGGHQVFSINSTSGKIWLFSGNEFMRKYTHRGVIGDLELIYLWLISWILGLISVSSKVDRESNPEGYNLVVTAKDHGYPLPQFSTAFVNISVSDINDNAPRFDKFTYSAVVREDSVIGETITAVHAVDDDEGLAGEIVYIITGLSIVSHFSFHFCCSRRRLCWLKFWHKVKKLSLGIVLCRCSKKGSRHALFLFIRLI